MRLIFFSIILLTKGISNAQELKIEEKTLTGIFEVQGKTKAALHAALNRWIAKTYNSAKDVIQMNDLESGSIILKGINAVSHKNAAKAAMSNNKYVTDIIATEFEHLIEIDVRDNRFRIVYKILDVVQEDYGTKDLFFHCINLKGADDVSIQSYNDRLEELFKKGSIGKSKIEASKSFTKPMFAEINTKLLSDMKLTMVSIAEATVKDDW